MAESAPNDKETPQPDSEAELTRELIEAVATAYFGACRRVAKLLNRRGKPR